MSSVCSAKTAAAEPTCRVAMNHPAADAMNALLLGLSPRPLAVEARQEVRRPFPFLLTLTPTANDGTTLGAEPITVVGKSLSSRGIGFYHREPIPYRWAILNLEGSCGDRMTVLVELCWCRFTRHGWYDSGGRFLERSLQDGARAAS